MQMTSQMTSTMSRFGDARGTSLTSGAPGFPNASSRRSRPAVQQVLNVSQKLKPPAKVKKGTQSLKPKSSSKSKQSSKPSFGAFVKKKVKQAGGAACLLSRLD